MHNVCRKCLDRKFQAYPSFFPRSKFLQPLRWALRSTLVALPLKFAINKSESEWASMKNFIGFIRSYQYFIANKQVQDLTTVIMISKNVLLVCCWYKVFVDTKMGFPLSFMLVTLIMYSTLNQISPKFW